MLKKLKSSLVFICLISLLTGCVNQNQEVTSDQEITVAATSIAVTEILDQLNAVHELAHGIVQLVDAIGQVVDAAHFLF